MGVLLDERVRILNRVAPRGRVLDVGAGRGGFVLAARRAGRQCTGIEPSRQGSSVAVDLGAPVRRASIEQAEISPASLDAVTLWHVLEHLDAPLPDLRRVAGWLAPGGVLIIAVPNLRSLQATLGGSRWFHLDVPRHRSHFTLEGLDALLAQAGLERFHTRQVLLDNPFGMWQSLVNRLTHTPSYLYNLLRRNTPPRAGDLSISLLSLTFAPAATALELLAGALGHGGTVVIAARLKYDRPQAAAIAAEPSSI